MLFCCDVSFRATVEKINLCCKRGIGLFWKTHFGFWNGQHCYTFKPAQTIVNTFNLKLLLCLLASSFKIRFFFSPLRTKGFKSKLKGFWFSTRFFGKPVTKNKTGNTPRYLKIILNLVWHGNVFLCSQKKGKKKVEISNTHTVNGKSRQFY